MPTGARFACRIFGCLLLTLPAVGPVAAQDYTEVGDASNSVLAPTRMPTHWILNIYGSIAAVTDPDVYEIDIVDPNDFWATTNGSEGDTQLWLFTNSGVLIDFNDDMNPEQGNLAAQITGERVPSPGVYTLAVTQYCYEPVDSRGNALWLDDNTYRGSAWANWTTGIPLQGYCQTRVGEAPPSGAGKTVDAATLAYRISLAGAVGTEPLATIWPPDSLALVDLFRSTGGESWNVHTNWLRGPVSSWYGVELVRVEVVGAAPVLRVRNLALPENNLVGTLPNSLADLTYLWELSLPGNRLGEVIPSAIGEMAELGLLDLSHNALTGPIPSSLARLPSIEQIQLQDNGLSGEIPGGLGEAVSLIYLDLSSNRLGGEIPPSLIGLERLEVLMLGSNGLGGSVPPEIGYLPSLQVLEFPRNELSGPLPSTMTRLNTLRQLLFFDTGVCVPQDADFQEWLASLDIVEGNGVACEPIIGASPLPLSFGGVAIGSTKDLTLTISNTGTAAASVTVGGYQPGEEFQILSGAGTTTMGPGATRSVVVRFLPVSPGEKSSPNLTVEYVGEVGGGGFTVTTTGQGLAPSISVTPSALAFGNVQVAASKDLTLTIRNTGTATLSGSVGPGADFAGGGFSFVSGSGAFSLAAQASKNVIVRFAPASPGARASSVQIAHDGYGTDSPVSVSLTGSGTAPAISVAPSALAYGDVQVGFWQDLPVTITNTGTAALSGSVASGANFATGGYAFQSGSGAFNLEVGASKQVVVRFAPTAEGAKASSVLVTHNATNADSPFTVSLTGAGTAAPAPSIQVAPEALTFGDVQIGAAKDLTVTVSNTGTAPLTGSVNAGEDFDADSFALLGGSGGFSLEGGASRQISVRFAPASEGPKSSSIVIIHDATNADSPFTVSLTGAGTAAPAPSIQIAPQALTFGDVQIGATKDLSVTLTNTGNAALLGSVDGAADFTANGFSFQSGAGAFNLASGASKQVVVRFTPTAEEATASSLLFTHNASNADSPFTVTLTGAGTAAPAPSIQVAPEALTFGDVEVGDALERAATVSNLGTGVLEGAVAAGTGFSENGFSLIGGAGAFALSAGESLVIVVGFAAPSEGTFAALLEITHNATNEASPVGIPVSGAGIVAAVDPIAVVDSVATQPDTPIVIAVLTNDIDPTGAGLEILGLVSFPSQGVAVLRPDGTILYTPYATFTQGVDSFQYQISNGSSTAVGTVHVHLVSGASADTERPPAAATLGQNYPNPFSLRTVIPLTLDRAGHVTLSVYDMTGKHVETLIDQVRQAGVFGIPFAARNLARGAYLVLMDFEGSRQRRVLTVLK